MEQNLNEIWVDYHRCSTEEQAIEGHSIETQNKYTKEILNNISNVSYGGNYVDEGYSGSDTLDKRPDMLRLLTDAKDNKFNGLIIYKADRLGRIAEEREYIIQLLNKYGIKIICHSGEKLTDNTPQGVFIRKVLAEVDELEVRTLSYRVRGTMRARASEGEWKGTNPPYGYLLVKEEKRMDKEYPQIEQASIVWDLYINQLKGYSWIRDYFNITLKEPYYKNGKPELWTRERVKLIINSPLYAGFQYHNTRYSKFEFSEGKIKKPKEQWELYLANFLEPIITLEDFNKAQYIRKKKTEKSLPSINTSWLLTGLLFCGHCGDRMFGHPHWNKRILKDGIERKYDCSSYLCMTRHKKGNVECSAKQVVKKLIEEKIEEKVINFIGQLNNSDIEEVKKILYKQIEKDFNNSKTLSNNLKQIENKINKYYRDYENEIIEADVLNPAIKRLNSEKEQLIQEIETLSELNKTKEMIYLEVEKILNNISNWTKDYYQQNDVGFKKIKLMEVIDRIYVKDNEINIIYKIKNPNELYVSEGNCPPVVPHEHIQQIALDFINKNLLKVS